MGVYKCYYNKKKIKLSCSVSPFSINLDYYQCSCLLDWFKLLSFEYFHFTVQFSWSSVSQKQFGRD